jgi:diguanylate cyclase (GGDEF)-like protein
MMIDVDHFKRVNDDHGHGVGDEVLRSVGRALHDAIRTEDLVARYGGDEFIVLSRGADSAQAEQFGERLRKAIKERTIRVEREQFHLTLSIGVASYAANDPPTIMELIARADSALYVSKRQGRDRVSVWIKDGESKA